MPKDSASLPNVAVIGTGPAALMAADALASGGGVQVTVFDKRKSAGRKLLVAGSSGLNISNSLPIERFIEHYTGPVELWRRLIKEYPPQRWISFIEKDLSIGTFEGTSGRYFVEDMKAARLVQAWQERLKSLGVLFEFGRELVGLALDESSSDSPCRIALAAGQDELPETREFAAVVMALGGGSWEPQEKPLRWPPLLRAQGLAISDFTPSNVGYRVAWPEAFLKEAEGQPLKRVVATSSRGTREGDAMVTAYGIEGTPIYFTGETGTIHLDLRPDLGIDSIYQKLRAVTENLSPIRRVKKQLQLCPASLALVYHLTPKDVLEDPKPKRLIERIKAFPLELLGPQPLDEAISSAGGLALSELDDALMIRRLPGFFAAGEMLDWDVPTGGFLIQGCVAQGFVAGQGARRHLGL